MRVLFATTANDGHFGPLVPFVRACAAAGHEVRVAAPESFADALARAGVVHEPFADVPPEVIGPVMARLPDMDPQDADELVIREVFGRIDAQAGLPGVIDAIERWRPDVVVRESAELASAAAAERAGVPHVHVCIGMHELAARFAEVIAEPVEELGGLAGLDAGRLGAAIDAETVFSLVPEVLDAAGGALPAGAAAFRRFHQPNGAVGAAPAARPTEWGDPERPLVYVTFGTVAGVLPPFAGIFREALDVLAGLDVSVLMTVGRAVDPAGLGPLPPHARVEQWVAQDLVLPHAAAVLGHGGFGTTLGVLAAGVPQIVAPLFAFDQVVNGAHVAAVGAGLTTAMGPGAVAHAAAAIPRLIAERGFAESARTMALALRALPPPADAVSILADLIG